MDNNKTGFTLVELLLAVMILAGAIAGALLLFTSSMLSSQQAWDTTVAVSHAEQIFEEMQLKPTIKDIMNTNWKAWIRAQKLNTLTDESIQLTFADPGADPLDVQVQIDWMTKSRENSITLNTKFTK